MIRITVSPQKAIRGWVVRVDRGTDGYSEFKLTKFFAIRYAVSHAKRLHELGGETVSVVIQKKNGRFQEERTFGHDPARSPG